MKRFVNVRFPLLAAVALAVGILLGYLFIRIQVSLLFVILVVPFAAIIAAFCIVCSKFRLLVFSLSAALFLTIGTVYGYLKLDTYADKELVSGDTYSISATVCDKGAYDNGEYIILNNVTANGVKIGGKIKAYLSNDYGEFCDIGYRVNFITAIKAYDLFPYGKLSYNALNNVKYHCNIFGGLYSEYKFTLFGSVNRAIRNTLFANVDEDTAAIAYAMLTGNTDGIEDGALSAFRYGGVAHVFAVSGLHIGLIYAMLSFICKKLRLKSFVGALIILTVLFLYCGVCGFSASSVRALIMCAVAALAKISYAKYDPLNSLAISAVILLLINPLYLFGVGFELSMCAVLSIILLAKNIARPLKRLPRKIRDSVSVSLSAQAGSAPIMLARFGYLSGAGVFLNVLLIPVLSAIYTFLFITVICALILPFAAQYILPCSTVPLQFVISLIADAGFEKALLRGFGAGAFVAIYFALIFVFSDKLNFKTKYRIISAAVAGAMLCTYVPLKTFSPLSGYRVIVSAYYGGGEVLFKSGRSNILVVTQDISDSHVDSTLSENYSSDVDALIILGGENCVTACDKTDLKCDVYVYYKYLNIQPYKDRKIKYEKQFTIGGVQFTFADGYSLLAEYGGVSVGICAGNYVPIDYCNLLIGDSPLCNNADTVVSFNERSFDNCVYDDGNFVYTIKNNAAD